MGSQMIQVIILAAIALFLIYRLRNVLGTREGYEKTREVSEPSSSQSRRDRSFEVIEGGTTDPDIADVVEAESAAGKALSEMKRVDREFSVTDFTHGARQAYEMILMAYENGDLEMLEQYLSPEVYQPFADAIAARRSKGYSVEATFAGVREVTLLEANFDPTTKEGDITMRFVGELTSVVRDPDGRVVEGDPKEIKQQKDVWTFTRVLTSDNPNWLLTGTGG